MERAEQGGGLVIGRLKRWIESYVIVFACYLYYFGLIKGTKKLIEDRKYWR